MASEYRASKEEIDKCALHTWHDKLRKVTIKTQFLPLPPEFIEYLTSDGLFLPASAAAEEGVSGAVWDSGDEDSDNNSTTNSENVPPSDNDDYDDDDDDDGAPREAPSFPEVEAFVTTTVETYGGGGVVPKLNWSAPVDATWAAFSGSVKCVTPGDVFLLLQASDCVAHDILRPYGEPEDGSAEEYVLALRKFYTLQPGLEFRVFVVDSHLVAISQRHTDAHFSFLDAEVDGPGSNKVYQHIADVIVAFWEGSRGVCVRDVLSDHGLTHYSMDVYMEREYSKAILIDVNPLTPPWSPCLFTWDELLDHYPAAVAGGQDDAFPRVRVVLHKQGIKPAQSAYAGLPLDLVHFHDILAVENPDLGSEQALAAAIKAMQDAQQS